MALMKQGYRNYMAKGNWILKTQPTKTNHPLDATQGLVMYAGRWLFIFGQILLKYQARVYSNYWKIKYLCLCLYQAAAAEKDEALPHGTRLIDLDTFRKRLQGCTHTVN